MLDIVRTIWNREFYGVGMYRIYRKLKWFKTDLKGFKKKQVGDLPEKVSKAKRDLEELQLGMFNNPDQSQNIFIEREKISLLCVFVEC